MLFLFLNVTFSSIERKVNDVIVKESNASVLIFEYHPQYNPNTTRQTENGTYDIVNVENTSTGKNLESGSPQILEREISFGVPSLENPKVEIVATDYEDVQNINLIPVPFWEKGEELPLPKYETKSEFYSQNNFLPQQIFSLEETKKFGGLAKSTIHLAAFQYNPVSKTLRKFSRVVVRVEFPSPKFISNGKQVSQQLESSLINFDFAKNWTMNPQPKLRTTSRFNSVLSSGNWWTIPIQSDGMYKITGATLSANGIPRNSVSTIKIYNNGGGEIPEDPSDVTDDGDLRENAIYVVDNNSNGNFEDNDYIVFYGKSLRGWKYDSSSYTYSHFIHHYSETNKYFLTYGNGNIGKRMGVIASTFTSASIETTVVGKVFREEEKINVQQSGREWLGELFNAGDDFSTNLSLPGFISGQAITYKFSLAARSAAQSTFSVYEHQNTLFQSIIAENPYIHYDYGTFCFFSYPMVKVNQNFSDDVSKLRFTYSALDNGTGYLDWVEIFYPRRLKANLDQFHFDTRDTTGTLEYSVENFSSNIIQGFDATDYADVKLISPLGIQNNTFQFQTQVVSGSPLEIYICGNSGFKNITSLKSINNQNLHGDTTGIDYVIVSPKEFEAQASRLATFRKMNAKKHLNSIVVTTQEVYNEFSSGVQDVGAIRNYAKYLYETSTGEHKLKYLLLFGDGDFDYKRISTSGENFILPWETENSFGSLLDSYVTDDFYGAFSTPLDVDIAVGRLCVRTQSDAKNVVDKIIEYETHPIHDGWKNRTIYISDDFKEDGITHIQQADKLAQIFTPTSFQKTKIYSAEFSTVATSLGRRKPDANEAIVNEWNKGALLINFTGHGNPRVWTHEQIFTRESSIPQLHNKGKYPLVIAATCNFGQFDNIGTQSSAEILVNSSESGAIAVFAATRAVYSYSNEVLNDTLYDQLFRKNQNGKITWKRLGDAILNSKIALRHYSFTNENQHRFYLLGDPALEFAIPYELASIDSINGIHLSNASPVLLRALSKPKIYSAVIDSNQSITSTYNGEGILTVFDSYKKVNIADDGGSYTYNHTGDILFNGVVDIVHGISSMKFIIPKDITYDTTSNARISLYFWNNESDGSGVTELVNVGGTDTSASLDLDGPKINVYIDKNTFRNGDIVSSNPRLFVELSDSSGINTSGSSVGHKLEARIDNNPQSIDLSQYYQSEINSFTKGKAEYQFSNLSEGKHQLTIRAWDTYNNSSQEKNTFFVKSSKRFTIENVYNYPNPFSRETYFTFLQNQTATIDVEIKIYTVTGRIIQTLQQKNITDNFVRIRWDGRDSDGDQIANGLYLYKIIAKSQDRSISTEATGKMSLIR